MRRSDDSARPEVDLESAATIAPRDELASAATIAPRAADPGSAASEATVVAKPGVMQTISNDRPISDTIRRGRPRLASVVIGRYIVLDELGAGGMGVVYAAYDPKLDRKVAVKMLQDHDEGSGARFEREAQALARLSHPNVVAIYDVGVFEGRRYLAMELVEGTTLADWMRSERRTWRETVAMFVASGRGLAAAHAAGVVHRDFKPHNVIVGADGRPRVLDFGLARSVGSVDDIASAPKPRRSANDMLSAELTMTGTVMGTTVYMAPEARRGENVTEAGDQFSFCVALYEGLYGARPFDSAGTAEVLPPVPPPPADSNVPAWLRKVVLQGLAPKVSDRFSSMDVLLAALEDDPAVKRRRVLAAAGGLVVVGGLVAGAYSLRGEAPAPTGPCANKAPLAGVWDEPMRGVLGAAFAATGPDGAAHFTKAGPALDGITREWLDARAHACRAIDRGGADASLQVLRLDCLDRQRMDLAAVIAVFTKADATIAKQATAAVHQLPRPTVCDNPRALQYIPPPEPAQIERLAALRSRMSEAQALQLTGKEKESGERLDPIVADARALGYAPALAEALYLRGRRRLVDFANSIEILDEAERVAIASRADLFAGRAAAARLREAAVAGYDEAKVSDWERRARAWIEREPDLETEFSLEQSLGIVAMGRGDYTRAQQHMARAIDVGTRAFGSVNTRVFGIQTTLTLVLVQLGRYEDATRLAEPAIATFERAYGTTSLRLRDALDNYGLALANRGMYREARAALDRALALSQAPDVFRAAVLSDLARVAVEEGDHATAIDRGEAGLALFGTLGVERYNLAINLDPLAAAYVQAGRPAEGLALARRCLDEFAKAKNEGPDTTACRRIEGSALVALGRFDEARGVLERALALQSMRIASPGSAASLRFALARAIAGDPRASATDRERVPALVAAARTELAALPFKKRFLDELDAWKP